MVNFTNAGYGEWGQLSFMLCCTCHKVCVWLVVSVGLVGRSGWLLCLTCLGSAGLRLSLTGPAPEPELAAWPKVAAYRASPWLYLCGKSQLDRLPEGNWGLTGHSINAFCALPGVFSLILDVEKYCQSLPQLKRGVFCDEGKHQVLS